ncbi:hypothetical protein TI39_contig348g00041 [Zymoseptoria brevis]|uniref:F-box domain-containing protein n=1 Tax=Zymoseptoria brevis TaxID=1047168 RepID=A0A0F4GQZ0_9PEZI|nr:hypothetical protein TI39_contig348g00041 [Zymoseptoria brevis]
MARVFRQSIIDDKLTVDIAALYSPQVWTPLTEQTLLDLVADPKSWNGREKYMLPLCDFLNSIAEEVRTESPVRMRVEAEASRPFPLLELPNDIRVRIHDVIAAQMLPKHSSLRDRPLIQTHSNATQGWNQDLLVVPFTQVSKQLRLEFLPRWHRVVELNFDVTGTQYDPDLIDEWIGVFGPSRVPLTRSFTFEFGDDIVRLELRGCPSQTVFGHRLHHEQDQT